jgi:hypothetical protein
MDKDNFKAEQAQQSSSPPDEHSDQEKSSSSFSYPGPCDLHANELD